MFRLPQQFYLIRYRVIHLIWGPRKFSICGKSEGSSRPNVAEYFLAYFSYSRLRRPIAKRPITTIVATATIAQNAMVHRL